MSRVIEDYLIDVFELGTPREAMLTGLPIKIELLDDFIEVIVIVDLDKDRTKPIIFIMLAAT